MSPRLNAPIAPCVDTPRASLRDRLVLHVLTDRAFAGGRSDAEIVSAALAGGATVVQLRGKGLTGTDLIGTGHQLRDLCDATGALFIVNDRVDVALATDADGVHIGQDDMPVRDARRLLGSDRLLGVSVGTADEAVQAVEESADYIGVGPIFTTSTKRDAGAAIGLRELAYIGHRVAVPIVGIGGITTENAGAVIAAGATGIAVISAVVAAQNVEAATRNLRQAMLTYAPPSRVGEESGQ